MTWTDDKIKQLKKLWQKGRTTAQIARELGLSKNSIIGKIHRMDLTSRPSPIKKKAVIVKAATKTQARQMGLLDLKSNSCRWPIGDPDEPDFHFCGQQVATGKPYCPEHCKIAYTSLKELASQKNKEAKAALPAPPPTAAPKAPQPAKGKAKAAAPAPKPSRKR
ncbi:MAG: GcrA family cell cycle regulator [Alphaproteobacteria bacterium]|nr:GcrA family cell cycle regulator [Alphaproteobacteria bacterium]